MAGRATIGGLQMLDTLAAFHALGLDPEVLCRAAGIDPVPLARPEARVPAALAVRVFSEAERMTGDPLVGLHAAEHFVPRGPLIYLMLSSSGLGEAIRYWQRFSRIPISTLEVRLDVGSEIATMAFDLGDATLDASPHVADLVLLSVLRPMKLAAAKNLRAHEVHLRHELRGDPAEAPRAFGCPVRFGQAKNALLFHRRDLQGSSRMANPLIAEQIEKFATALESRLTPRPTLRERVADVTRSLLATGIRADRAQVAQRLHVSEPSLNRALQKEQTTFKVVRDAVLWEIAEVLLSSASFKIEVVALSVGFADGPSFAKAFKRHTGESPKRYRERIAARMPATPGGRGAARDRTA